MKELAIENSEMEDNYEDDNTNNLGYYNSDLRGVI